ncbi:MAPEG family protein [Aestuariivirga sp. YIM B02566]|uniref:MAPEG family protein n=1 Tax=Taklimakanibacter albus TaxID=2800327 RepID=A0ACC5R9X5_9HYPH|nr:MAPEG family protein [Aestuariivirga sp. YIM B02566]MBK1869458.1 MAPEG family protein [Aestuariivirga sp. YIM B02566]
MNDKAPVARFPVRSAIVQVGLASLVVAFIWWACYRFIPPSDMLASFDRVLFGLKWSGIAILLTFLTGIEAVSHERLVTEAFDPLAGKETKSILVNLRYLQNTLEQLMLFVPGLLLLAAYAEPGAVAQSVTAAALVWILARFAFWIGYRRGPQYRIAGLVGMAQSMIILLYVSARFGYELGGAWGASVPLILFAIAETVLVVRAFRQAATR